MQKGCCAEIRKIQVRVSQHGCKFYWAQFDHSWFPWIFSRRLPANSYRYAQLSHRQLVNWIAAKGQISSRQDALFRNDQATLPKIASKSNSNCIHHTFVISDRLNSTSLNTAYMLFAMQLENQSEMKENLEFRRNIKFALSKNDMKILHKNPWDETWSNMGGVCARAYNSSDCAPWQHLSAST